MAFFDPTDTLGMEQINADCAMLRTMASNIQSQNTTQMAHWIRHHQRRIQRDTVFLNPGRLQLTGTLTRLSPPLCVATLLESPYAYAYACAYTYAYAHGQDTASA